MTDHTHVFQISGGAGSWAATRRHVDVHGTDGVILLFADTLIEDPDLYRFLDDVADDIGVPITRIADGRTPWEVFRDKRYIGNSRIDPCSKILKRDLLWEWMEDNCDPENTTVYIGIDWSESHRIERMQKRLKDEGSPWTVKAPLCDPPYLDKAQILKALEERGIRPPVLYDLGFPHNNCGGFCIKAGQAQFVQLLKTLPARFAHHEEQERITQEHIGTDSAILRDRSIAGRARYIGADPDRVIDYGGRKVDGVTGRELPPAAPLPLSELRRRAVESGALDSEVTKDARELLASVGLDANEWGGCGCAID